jgi:predicted metal-dependent phosphoesterase TrpH
MAADLHAHSTRSDGLLTPTLLVEAARGAGLRALALTDHDTVSGVDEARLAAAELELELIAGVELSIRDVDPATGAVADHHLLGLFVDPAAPALLACLERLQEQRRDVARDTLARLAELGLPVDPARVAAFAAGATVTRPHIARAMVEAGHVPDERTAFARYLGNGKPAAIVRATPGPAETIAVVQTAGGIASLAHPVFPSDGDTETRLRAVPGTLDRLRAVGLQAVETRYPDATPAISDQLARWAAERDLLITSGSDYHGPDKAPFVPLGHTTATDAELSALRALLQPLPAKLDGA